MGSHAHVVNLELSGSKSSIFNKELSYSCHPLLILCDMSLEDSFIHPSMILDTLQIDCLYILSLTNDDGYDEVVTTIIEAII